MATLPVKFFQSSDAGAPVLKGAAGELRAILDACLLTGFNVRPLRGISMSGDVARLALDAGHGFKVLDVIKLDGALAVDPGDEYRVSGVGADWVEFTSANAITFQDGAAVRRAPLNWVRGFGSGNVVSYTSKRLDSSGAHLVIDDTNTLANTTTGTWKAKITAFERMTDIGVGENKFADGYWVKGTSTSWEVTPWAVFGDEYMIYVFIDANVNKGLNAYSFGCFGDIRPEKNTVKKICICSLTNRLLTNPAFNYLGAAQRYASPNVLVRASRGGLDSGLIGAPVSLGRLEGGVSLISGRGPVGVFVARYDFLAGGGYVVGRSPGLLYLVANPPRAFSLYDGRFFCMPCISDSQGESDTAAVDVSHAGAVMIDVIGPWR